jgi:FAD/FMN-containing dehydrogenase
LPELFEVMLGGLGQCGVITRARVDLVPAKAMARLHTINYTDTATFFQDLRALISRGELDECYNLWTPFFGGEPAYQIQAVSYFNPSQPPDTAHLLRGLSVSAETVPFHDMGFLDWILAVDAQIDFLQAVAGWNDLIKPWYDVWLPDSTVEQSVGEVMSSLTLDDIGPTGFLLLFPMRRSSLTRPFFRMPQATAGDDWVYLFDVLTASPMPGRDPAYVQTMLARNRTWFERARDLGATRYPIGALAFTTDDWARHYGELWGEFRKRKQRYDPDNILSPGSGIFS